ncbi:MAG: barstar family protein [Elusimicrobiales bacterium]|nr:barstar family protein [Elusimicrobiales bacterium]
MKLVSKVIAISLFMSCAASAAQDSALGALKGSAGAASLSVPAAAPVRAEPDAAAERALASDVLDLTPGYADFLLSYAKAEGYAVLELDGARMTSKASLLEHATRVLRFPGVPENWDAMIDFIGDLPGIHRNRHLLIVTRNAGLIARADARLYADYREVAEFACRNAREWSKGDLTIKFAFVQ